MGIIALLTDFGLNDWYVGTMKGVIHSIIPTAQIVDITHGIPSGDILAGAFALKASYGYFPQNTIFVVVVDPGVGSLRNAIAVKTEKHFFIGPDNGLLSLAIQGESVNTVRFIQNRKYFLSHTSNTFHGRDIFAPVAAHLANGLEITELGPLATNYEKVQWEQPIIDNNSIEGKIIYFDHFGNAVTNILTSQLHETFRLELESTAPMPISVICSTTTPIPFASHYQAVKNLSPLALIGSHGFLEIAVNGGSAFKKLDLKVGMRIRVERNVFGKNDLEKAESFVRI